MSSKPNVEGYFVILWSCLFVHLSVATVKRPHVYFSTVETAAPSAAVCLVVDTIWLVTQEQTREASLCSEFFWTSFTQIRHNHASITNATHWQLLKTVCVCVRAGFDEAYPTHTDAIQHETLQRTNLSPEGETMLHSAHQTLWRDLTRLLRVDRRETCNLRAGSTESFSAGSGDLWLRDFDVLRQIWGWNDCDTDSLCSIDLHSPDLAAWCLYFVI